MIRLLKLLLFFLSGDEEQHPDYKNLAGGESMVVHDFTMPAWGRDVYIRYSREEGYYVAMGWTRGIQRGHYIETVGDRKKIMRWRVESIEYYDDPKDMFRATFSVSKRGIQT